MDTATAIGVLQPNPGKRDGAALAIVLGIEFRAIGKVALKSFPLLGNLLVVKYRYELVVTAVNFP
jgi:hypothetical protein